MAFPIGLVLGGLSALSGLQASGAARKQANAVERMAKQNRMLFNRATPFYLGGLNFMAQRAGISPVAMPSSQGGAGFGDRDIMASETMADRFGGQRTTGTHVPGQGKPGALPNSALGIYGQGEDALRMNQAQEEIDAAERSRAQQLAARLGAAGIGGSTLAAAQGMNAQDAFRKYADFRRQLAMGAGQEQERRVSSLMGMLAPGLSGGGQAAQLNLGLANQFGQQAGQAFGGLGDALNQWLYMQQLKKLQGGQPNPLAAGSATSLLGGY